ncbi:MAG: FHA domain-containing protein [Anaerolineaceae bacterium]|nr:FHA domain-containing protein [Anaerolineaceae bacterium]
MELKLILAKGEPKGKVIPATKNSLLIGRQDDCDLVISSAKVSRQHCRIDISDDTASLADLGSGNGTFVNGQKVAAPTPLKAGDRIVVGPLGFVVQIDGLSTAAPLDVLSGIQDDAEPSPAAEGDDDIIQLSEDDLLDN